MKKAPNVKLLPKDKFIEAVIFAGEDAYAHAQHWIEVEGKRHGDDVPPVYLGAKQLADLANLRIVDEGRECVRVYRAGDISGAQLLAIETMLAIANVQRARLFDGMYKEIPEEDWTEQLPRLREQATTGEALAGELLKEKDSLKPRVDSRKNGIYWVTPKEKGGEITETEQWLSSPFEIIGEGTDKDSNISYIALRWQRHGEEVTRLIDGGAVGDRDGWRIMKDGGLKVTTKPHLRAVLSDWMQNQGEASPFIRITPRAGWCDGVYVMPDGVVIGESDVPVMFNGGSATANAYRVSGTVESWRDKVAALAVGNPFMMLAVGVALAAPMMKLVGADSFGIHLFASSTASKTTTADLATSLYGEPKAQRLTWYGTALGIANEAESHNDGLLSLDEIGQGTSARDVYTSAYTLFNGKGKLQGNKDGGNRVLKHWETVAISTGEVSIETFLLTEGIKVKAGQLVRLLNIPVTRPEVFHGYAGGRELADAINTAGAENFGSAGREWIKWLAANKQHAKAAYQSAKQRWTSLIPQSYGEQVQRVSGRFAVIEAALLLGAGITGWDVQACRDALQHCFHAWVKEFGAENKEHQQIIEQTEAFLNAHGMSRFAPLPYDERDLPIRNLAGYRKENKADGDQIIFYTFPAVFNEEISAPFNKDTVAKVLHDAGMLQKPSIGRGWQTRTPRLKHLNGAQIRVYAVMLATVDDSEGETTNQPTETT